VTTEKDLVRMRGNAETATLADKTSALPVGLRIENEDMVRTLLRTVTAA
jgi:tetraacyldisaccharide-1-P 4'-kinase